MKTALQLLFFSAIVSCSIEPKKAVPSVYKSFFHGGSGWKSKGDQLRLPFDSISIKRTGCLGECPVYEMILNRDHTAKLNAQSYLPKLGEFEGEIHINTYAKLCYLIQNSHFRSLKPHYGGLWTDDASCIVTVRKEKKLFSVNDYGSDGPIELWAIQQSLDAVRNEISWTLVR